MNRMLVFSARFFQSHDTSWLQDIEVKGFPSLKRLRIRSLCCFFSWGGLGVGGFPLEEFQFSLLKEKTRKNMSFFGSPFVHLLSKKKKRTTEESLGRLVNYPL